MPVIMDVAVVVVIALGVIFGARKGLVKSLAGLLIVVVALLGAAVVASSLAGPVTKMVVPAIEETLSGKLEALLEEGIADSTKGLLESGDLSFAELGDTVESLVEEGTIQISDLGEPLKGMLESGQIQISELGEYLEGLLASGQMQLSDLEEQVQTVLANNSFSLTDLPLDSTMLADALEQLGLDEDFRENLMEKVETIMTETGVSLVSAAIEAVVRGLVYGLLYIVAFILLLILLHIIVNALDLLMKLPVLKSFNRLGGALVGFAEAALMVFVVMWLARAMGLFFETEALTQTHVLRFFVDNNFLTLL